VGRRRKNFMHLRWLGALLVLIILGVMGLFLVTGQPVVSAAEDNNNVYAYDALGASVNATDIKESDGWLEFTLASDAAVLKIEYKTTWADLKGTFTHVVVDLGKLEYSAIWKLAKVYLSDGSTDVYIGSISYDEYEQAHLIVVDQSDIKVLDDLKKPMVIIKFYDEDGNLINVVKGSVEQDIKVDFVITAEKGTLTSYIIAAFMAFVAALRKVVSGLTTGLTAFFIAITTNTALLVIFGTIGMLMLWYFIESGRLKRIL